MYLSKKQNLTEIPYNKGFPDKKITSFGLERLNGVGLIQTIIIEYFITQIILFISD